VPLSVKASQEQLTLSEGDLRGATFDYRSSTGNLNIATNGGNARTAPQFTLDLNGKVGIGTSSPSTALHLKGGGANNSVGSPIITIQKRSGGAVDDGQTIGGLSFVTNDDGVNSGSDYERAKIIAESQNTSSATRLEFWTSNNNADIAEHMRIIGDGTVVINSAIALGDGLDGGGANRLDDYEEGTWTMGITDGSNTATLGSGYNYGRYRKVGSIVHIQGFLDVSSIGSCSGNITLTGLPFAVPAGSQYYGHIVMVHATGLSRSSGQNLTGYPAENSSNITLKTWDVSTGTSTLQANELANGEFIFGGSYMVA
jgi:hypothetical protein